MKRVPLFVKLILVLAGAGLFIFLSVTFAIRTIFLQASDATPYRVHLVRYFNQIGQEIGNPADREKAAQFAKEVGGQVRIEDSTGAWASDEKAPQFNDPIPNERNLGNIRLGRRQGKAHVIIQNPGQRILLLLPGNLNWLSGSNYFLITAVAVLLVLIVVFALIHRILAPISALNRGVGEIAKGNFAHRVVTASQDELGKLADSFNQMSARLDEMIRGRERLLLDISHELRSPLTRAKVALEYLPAGTPRESIALDLRELETMVAEILESARLDSQYGGMDLRPHDLSPLLGEWTALYPQVDLDAAVSAVAKIDIERFRRVLVNLVENAAKYSGPGRVRVTLEKKAESILISVVDSGPGIPVEELERVFEPFYRVDKSRSSRTGGYGLGLSLCRKIVQGHGGKIWLESREGQGTSAFIEIPLSFT